MGAAVRTESAMRFLALDFETSGLDPKRHAPVSLGVALFQDGHPDAQEEWLFQPPRDRTGRIGREYDVCALEVSGKTWTQLKREGAPHQEVCRALQEWAAKNNCREATIVAFNAPFDLAFYGELLFLAGAYNRQERRFRPHPPPLVGPWHCARLLAIENVPNLAKHDLETVARHFNLQRTTPRHSAQEDAILAGWIYQACFGRGSGEWRKISANA